MDLYRVNPNETTHQLTSFNLERRSKTVPIAPGETVTIGSVEGSGHLANLWLTFPGWFWQHWNTGAPISQTILKTLILRIYWDGAKRPAVEAPMGDFFGVGLCEVASFASKYFGMSSGGFFCKWPMPFRKGFRIEIENRDASISTDIFLNALYQLHDVDDDAAYLHAQFRTGKYAGPEPLEVGQFKGRGHLAGCILSMQGEDRNYLSFLEAPEYIYVDDDWETPRIVGTGLEDYFLGGWYFREGTFTGPLHGVPVKDTLNASIAMYRTHEADAVRFTQRLRMAFISPWEASHLKPYAASSVVFAYLDSPGGQNPPVPSREDLLCWYRVRNTDHQSIP